MSLLVFLTVVQGYCDAPITAKSWKCLNLSQFSQCQRDELPAVWCNTVV
jgi:hypothetical protein